MSKINFESEVEDFLFSVCETYKPATTLKDSTITMTTAEFADLIRENFPDPGMIDDLTIYLYLKKKGYVFRSVGRGSTEWLFRKD